MISIFEGLFAPQHLLVIGIIAILLVGRRLPDIAYWLGKKSVEFRKGLPNQAQILVNCWEKIKKWLRRPDNNEPGGSLARLEPPDKPRPPAQVALVPPKSTEDIEGLAAK
jgi:hypothetical protein